MRRPLFVSLRQAWDGFRLAFRNEPHLQLHCAAALLVLVVMMILPLTWTQRCLVLVVTGSVIVVELINTAIERLVHLLKPQWNEVARDAKDMAAAAVCVTVGIALIVGLILFGPYLLFMIRHV